MACATGVSTKRKSAIVRIANPVPGGVTHIPHERAERFVRNHRARFDSSGKLWFYGQSNGKTRAGLDVVKNFSGLDARPDRAVLPPSPDVLARMGTRGRARGPLVPPLRSAESAS